MARKTHDPAQGAIEGTEQERIPKIETWARKHVKQREIIAGLKMEKKNIDFKLDEAMKENSGNLAKGDDGELIYHRGDLTVTLSTKESLAVEFDNESGSVEVEGGGD